MPLLIYPFGRLFFVRRADVDLHDAILAGLQRAFADGSYQRMFAEAPGYSRLLDDPGFDKRLRLRIDNPQLSPEFRSIPSQYFLH